MIYFVVIYFIALTFFYLVQSLYLWYKEENENELLLSPTEEEYLFTCYETYHEDQEISDEMNAYLFKIILTKEEDTIGKICRLFYDMEIRIHGGAGSINRDSKILCCFHKNLDPIIVSNIIDYKFPGVLAKFTRWIQTILGKRYIIMIQNKIKKHECMSTFISRIKRIIALKAEYFDTIKDIALTILILDLVGGLSSLRNLPTNFTSVVIITMVCSIIIPLLMSSLHMMVNNPELFLWSLKDSSNSKIYQLLWNICILLSSIFIPVLLKNQYEATKEVLRKKIRSTYSSDEIKLKMIECKIMKKQLAQFQRIYLGNK